MKKMQTIKFKVQSLRFKVGGLRLGLVLILVVLGSSILASPENDSTSAKATVDKADSLFHLKQYTQSLEIYQSLYAQKLYSPSMLLKMAYIQEGLGHLAQSMYYLNLYYLVTRDPQALNKLEDVAAKNRLEGYGSSDAIRLVTLLKENHNNVTLSLAAVCLFLLALASFQKIKKHQRPVIPAAFLSFFLALLFANTWFNSGTAQGIVSNSFTYLMEGPSAGSSVVSIIGEGHRLEILGKKDVWLKVKWTDKEVYVRETELLKIRI